MARGKKSFLVSLAVFVACVRLTIAGCVFDPICRSSSDCLNGGKCFKNVCHCTDFYIGDHCETAFQCKTDADCLHNGKCSKCSPGYKATCDCAFGYTGANCAVTDRCVNEAKVCSTSSDCDNGGTCRDNVCHCTGQYIGFHCEIGQSVVLLQYNTECQLTGLLRQIVPSRGCCN
ncbi:hypothetical protein NP493_450g00011 [Ridgeia piscesae]|uniref:EGF-like domain-containing protein n=1 Tax=Ridgeia piscesae TaxID=27915 RepID=A0AAD9KZ96_RIDPI|nr:hypothetical protein NP493_450g00011 [Ridgeia piscesae]